MTFFPLISGLRGALEDLQFVDQGDIDGPVGVLKDLAGFRDLGAEDSHDFDNDLAIKRSGQLETQRIDSADNLGDRQVEMIV
jgi:hypothetical protein